VVGVWVGNADNTPMLDITGVSGAGPIWNEFMREVLLGQPEYAFERPEGVVRAEVCATSGLLPTELCPRRAWEWFIEGTVPTEQDNLYQEFEIDTRTGLLADEDTPDEYRKDEVYLVLPPEARDWAAHQGIPPPPDSIYRVGQDDANPLRLLSPDTYTIYQISPMTPLETQQIRLSVVAPPTTVNVTYWLNDEPLATLDTAPYDHWWTLEPGFHTIWATAKLESGEMLETEPRPFTVDDYVPPYR
jgi:membrane carboxypeptidase/penicillin-binding protein PbpC